MAEVEEGQGFFSSPATHVGLVSIKDGSHQISFELHGNVDASKRMVFVMGKSTFDSGFKGTFALWQPFVDHFITKNANEHSILLIDNRGVGESTAGNFAPYSTSKMARDVIQVLDHVGWTAEHSVHVVGVSMGGMISQELVLAIPDRIATLTLICSCAKFKSPTKSFSSMIAMFVAMINPPSTTEGRIQSVSTRLFSEDWLVAHDPNHPKFKTNYDRFFSKMFPILTKTPTPKLQAVLGQGLACLTHYVSPARLETIGKSIGKVTIVVGTGDLLIDPQCSYDLAKNIPGSELIACEGCGHGLIEDSEAVLIGILERNFDYIPCGSKE